MDIYYYGFMETIRIKKVLISLLFVFCLLAVSKPAYATTFELIAPSGTLTRGQEVQFIINIDTKTQTLTSAQIGMTYDTRYLEYVSAIPGEAMNTVSVTPMDGGKLLINGTSTAGFSGKGVFAYINLKLIAQAPGSTELCVLWAPSTTPTSGATSTPGSTATPAPTSLPKSGSAVKSATGGLIGFGFLLVAIVFYFLKTDHSKLTTHSKKNA
jgi:hypothetical protein